ncbi:iron-siderophore ABC transporter substrate-binding protein [Pseudogemmobacter sonorensis]|uniref:iron-siderophore ABC transporter substrate-binding protein n=1 Tax=Pseudogemmobacter sonorensis TaxID=2989681 RepID=UPI00369754F2
MRFAATLILALILPFAATAQDCDGRLLEGPDYIGAPLCIPADPQRILVIDPTFSLGMTLELDLPVVAAPLTGMSDDRLQSEAQAKGIADIGFMLEPSIEAVVSARPDLIIGSSMAESQLPMLARIAPTVLVTPQDWRAYYRAVARIAGREDRLAQLMAPLDERIAVLQARVPETKVSVIRITPWDFQVYLDAPDAWAPFALLHELGVLRSEYEMQTDPTGLKRPDWEEIAGLDGDLLLYIIGGSNGSAESGRWEEVSQNPLWRMLPAVQAGRVHPLDPGIWMEFSGIGSAHRVLDDVERLMIGAP